MSNVTTSATHLLPSKSRDTFKIILTTAFVILFGWSAINVELKWSRLLGAPADMYRLAKVMFGELPWENLDTLIGLMWDSIAIAWIGTLIAAVFAIPMSFLAAENLVGRPIAWVTRQIFNILRAVPEVILALLFIPVFGLSPMAGVMAIGIGSIGSLGKLFYEIIENIKPGPIEATDAVGASAVQRLRWGVLPQVAPELTSFLMYRFEVNIRASSVLGIVGAGGIGGTLADSFRFKEYGQAGLALIVVIVGTIAVDTISGAIRRRIVAGPKQERLADDEDSLLLSPDALVLAPETGT
ncbi:phosphonate ABC transporter, permease protein PhnE [Ilumatobacter coccineus]|uniref:Phosphonate ABC transporter permease protein n=1 Tax=Ilumatobacter coccineus (strain NBRC 103263 / KCTC 29153 / YM16-304) TaxID=1313172 RepID=A0A6C7EFK5_ILUCY|nr:phosphonate ABC transporter, permease protein PhnE [Ilumatobacter coccineus]BAN03805.1 phosphonate ABC transporter permease protein [Ilumatobacter coccineus YM16-304]